MERPRMAVDELEAQAGVGVVEIPRHQWRPRRGAECDRGQHADIAQHAPAIGQQQQGEETDPDHGDKPVVTERADRQAQRQLQRRRCVDVAQQPRAGVDAQQRSQRHRRVGQRQQPEGADQRQQQRETAGDPAPRRAEFARRDAHHQQRHHRGDQQERRAQRQGMVAAEFDTEPRQPRGQRRQVGIGRGEVLAFLPIERLVDEQRQPRGNQQLHQRDRAPQHPERQSCLPRCCFGIALVTHSTTTSLHSIDGCDPGKPEPRGGTRITHLSAGDARTRSQ